MTLSKWREKRREKEKRRTFSKAQASGLSAARESFRGVLSIKIFGMNYSGERENDLEIWLPDVLLVYRSRVARFFIGWNFVSWRWFWRLD